MKMIFRIARMELQKMFYSPIAWLILIIFAVQSGITFMDFIKNDTVNAELGYGLLSLTSGIFTGLGGFFAQIERTIYLYLPLLTMGLLSREFGSGSVKLLYSSPISNRQIVFGKYLSMMIFGLAMIIILLLQCIYGFIAIKEYDFPLVATGLLGLYMLICTYSAIGLFMSSLSSYQVVAAMCSFATFFVLEKIGSIWQGLEIIRDITYWLSISGRCDTFINGLICSEDVLYFILVSGLFISFTTFRLKGIREKSHKYISLMRYTGAFIIIALIGYISTIPSLMGYHDSTCNNVNTLTPNSQKILTKLKGNVTITTYVNIFDDNVWEGLPQSINYDLDRYEQYRRFKPDIKMKYKYYYALPIEKEALAKYNQRYPRMSIKEAMERSCKVFGIDQNMFKQGKDYAQEMPLLSELNRFVRKIETEDGKISYLRVYDDIVRFPFESQNTAAFKSLVMELPLVGFVKGHEERSVDDFGSRGYFRLAKEKPFRYSLINNGFDFRECDLSSAVDVKVDILIITDAKTAFSEEEMKNLDDYIDRGGNLIIACDLKRQDIMNPLVDRFGVKFLPGQIVEHNKGYEMNLITAAPTKEGQKLSYQFEEIAQSNGYVTMPGSVAISYKESNGFKCTPVFVSDTVKKISQIDSIGSWNELNTTDFVDEVAKYNPELGETSGSLTTALALTRKVEDKEQRIIILGDADCFSNSELSRSRNKIKSMNFNMATGMFFWLSNNEVPIDVRRPEDPDNLIYTKESQLIFLDIFYKIFIPGLLAIFFLLIWLRRKGQ